MYIPERFLVKDDFYCVAKTDYIPVNKNGDILLPDGTTTKGKQFGNDKDGYYMIGMRGVHRIVALTYLVCPGDVSKFDVNHINGKKWDNRLENLEWCTRKENVAHALKMGLLPQAKKIDILDLETGLVTTYPGLNNAAKNIGVNQGRLCSYLKSPKPLNPIGGKYDAKYHGDEYLWKGFSKSSIVNTVTKGNTVPVILVPKDKSKPPKVYRSAAFAARDFGIKESTADHRSKVSYLTKKERPYFDGHQWYTLRSYVNEDPTKMKDLIEKYGIVGEMHDISHRANGTPRIPVLVTDLKTGEKSEYPSLREYYDKHGTGKWKTFKRMVYRKRGYINGVHIEHAYKRNN